MSFIHDPFSDSPKLSSVRINNTEISVGDRVRLRPTRKADIFDIALAGRTAVVAAIEQDFEDQIHFAVTVDDDPGRDIGIAGKIAHRFFFRIDEVEKIADGEGEAT